MPTLFTHAVAPLLPGIAAGKNRISRSLLLAGTVAAVLPDIDVLSFRLGIPYAAALGHRGAIHSLLFGIGMAVLAALLHKHLRTNAARAFAFVGMAALSHPLLDMLTDGGLGVAIAWPLSEQRYFFPWHPIHVSPIGMRFFSAQAWTVIGSELLWIWLPVSAFALIVWKWRIAIDRQHSQGVNPIPLPPDAP
ncbi:metal-dependent hydrolase [Dyella caseinilytica]|uniref:Metal-dependent hydrolase n=1 Tax=Dyella caseinilytica TaxID=1849581 RepID=A0ABX7GQV2_9GAMM|nr:metal-dependent hydrolase [Dyella caseinilytica]QRN52197.1 metal-dependent hydrolase [Dyella caseinilytica]GGA14041.1 membrane protein [Dyella caseinilytica]